MKQRIAILKKDSPFFKIFLDGRVPIEHREQRVKLQGTIEKDVFFLDMSAITKIEFEKIVEMLADIFKAPVKTVLTETIKRGIPIRKSEVEKTLNDAIDMRFLI